MILVPEGSFQASLVVWVKPLVYRGAHISGVADIKELRNWVAVGPKYSSVISVVRLLKSVRFFFLLSGSPMVNSMTSELKELRAPLPNR